MNVHLPETKEPKKLYRTYISGSQVSSKPGGPYSTLTLLKDKQHITD